MAEVELWDSEMESLVKWLEKMKFPDPPFAIGEALEVVDLDVFLNDLRSTIDRCEFQKEQIAPLRFRLKSLKEWMEKSSTPSSG